ncbi:hypothetical protein Pla110_16300 [Polystyrenella longa]|uniref:LamG-like jellyroll fold domain-containing protein n=1 Tax=Polystyrenella longa TaxID=2528007 RepID=A0A518CL09_9PLAN|nr:LamG domain-containing protein [Polystyrenella longa]QDU79910.1 hypothetical protein Pla110_16300 [Polystyrenella longa]
MLRFLLFALSALFCLSPLAAQEGLVGHFKLSTNAKDSSSQHLQGKAVELKFVKGKEFSSTRFDGLKSELIFEESSLAKIGTKPFSVSMWVNLSEETDDVIGDLISQYDPATRRGFNLSVKTNSGVTSSQSNYRQLQFGIDDGQLETEWTDHGQPGNAVFIYSLATHQGELYAGTCESGVDGVGHLYRWLEGKSWHDCGAPDKSNAVSALAEFDGNLYVATSKYRLRGSALDESPNENLGGKIFRYDVDGTWTHCGTLSEIEAINGLVVYKDKLYASSTYAPGGLFRFDGGTTWTNCGLPDGKRVEALTVYNGYLYATGYDEAGIYRYDGTDWSQVGLLPDATQTYGFAVYEGDLYVSEWPNSRVYRYEGGDSWKNVGSLDDELESMPLIVYNGKMYCGSLPLAAVFRFDGDDNWSNLGRIDLTPDVKYRRAWSMSIFEGRLFAGTIPSGRVWSIAAGANATHDQTFPSGWHHVSAVKEMNRLKLYVDGKLVAKSEQFDAETYDLSTEQPLRIGNGQHDHFNGQMRDVRLFNQALQPADIQELIQQN